MDKTKATKPDDARVLQARLQLIVNSLPTSIIFNPALSAVVAVALAAPGSPFGHVAPLRLIGAVMVHLATSLISWGVYKRGETVAIDDLPGTRRRMIGLQALLSMGWVLTAWLCWLDGNAVNNVFIAMVMALVGFAASFTRAAHARTMLTAVAVQGLGTALLLAFSQGHAAHAMLTATPFYIGYILLVARGTRGRIDTMVQARLAADDMAVALAAAHAESLQKRYEAEAANASKTAFLANMSHELRTPLNAILGFSDIISNQSFGPDASRYADYARDIHNSGAHLLSLINDLLDVAKIEAGKMEIDPAPVDPRQVLDSVARLMASKLAAKNQTLHVAVDSDMPLVMADERAFRQMVLNLASNAVKFTQAGGEIVFGCLVAEGGLVVIVQDNGPGIAQDKLARVFQPFSQIDNRYDREGGGTGLGLALVQGLARLHGGRVWLESALGEGVKACIYFPSIIEPRAASLRA